MKRCLQFALVFLMLLTMTANGQLVIKNSQQNQLCAITQAGKVGIGTSAGTEPLGKLEIRTDNLRRIYTNDGSLYLTGGLRGTAYINSIEHYAQINGGGWDESAAMYYSTIVTPGTVAHIYNRSFVSGAAGNTNTAWQINSAIYLPKYMVVHVNDDNISFFQPHVSADNNQPGPMRFNSDLANGNLTIGGQAYKPGGGDWLASSDVRLKDVKGSYDRGLEDLLQLHAVKFNYKKNNARNHAHDIDYVGFIAQDVQKVFPEAVSVGKDGYLNFDMHVINVALVNALKEQQAQVEALKAENARLSAKISGLAELKTDVEKIKSLLNAPSSYSPDLSRADQ